MVARAAVWDANQTAGAQGVLGRTKYTVSPLVPSDFANRSSLRLREVNYNKYLLLTLLFTTTQSRTQVFWTKTKTFGFIKKRSGQEISRGHEIVVLVYHTFIISFFPTSKNLIDHFEVTWHLTMKLFPAKSLGAGKIAKLWRERVNGEVEEVDRMLRLS